MVNVHQPPSTGFITCHFLKELKYTNSDIRRMRTDLKLEFQGQLIVREKEWCKEKEHYEKLLKESRAKLDHEKKSNHEMV